MKNSGSVGIALCLMEAVEKMIYRMVRHIVQIEFYRRLIIEPSCQLQGNELFNGRGCELLRLQHPVEDVHAGSGSTPCRPFGMRSSVAWTSVRNLLRVSA